MPASQPASMPADAVPNPPAAPRTPSANEAAADMPQLSWEGSEQTSVGKEFAVAVRLSSQQQLTRIKSQVHFDGRVLQLLGAEAGDLIPSRLEGATPPLINQRAGVLQYVVPATSDSPVQGDGGFVMLHFKALTPTSSTPLSLQFTAAAADGRVIRVAMPAPLILAIAQ
jgi:hypothetical protein